MVSGITRKRHATIIFLVIQEVIIFHSLIIIQKIVKKNLEIINLKYCIRRYKTGYVWQDLVDDDLITPISDNEYVLKGSEISSIKGNNFLNTVL